MSTLVKQFGDCVKEFRQYGYDPYNSADDVDLWITVTEAINSGRLARSVPA